MPIYLRNKIAENMLRQSYTLNVLRKEPFSKPRWNYKESPNDQERYNTSLRKIGIICGASKLPVTSKVEHAIKSKPADMLKGRAMAKTK
jgi:hypothetical protein